MEEHQYNRNCTAAEKEKYRAWQKEQADIALRQKLKYAIQYCACGKTASGVRVGKSVVMYQ